MDAGEDFVRNGFASTTIEDITREAGVAKGTFYLYFDSKEAILAALRDRFIESCRERIAALASRVPAADWAGRLDAWVEGGISHYLDHVKLHDVVFHGGLQGHGSKAQNASVLELAELIRAGSAARAWEVESPELISVFLFSALHGIADQILSKRRSDHKAAIRLSQRIVRNALGIPPQAGSRRVSQPFLSQMRCHFPGALRLVNLDQSGAGSDGLERGRRGKPHHSKQADDLTNQDGNTKSV